MRPIPDPCDFILVVTHLIVKYKSRMADQQTIVGHVYDNGEFTILPEFVHRFPMGEGEELRLKQSAQTRLARRSARAKSLRQEAKARKNAEVVEVEPDTSHAFRGVASKAPRTFYPEDESTNEPRYDEGGDDL